MYYFHYVYALIPIPLQSLLSPLDLTSETSISSFVYYSLASSASQLLNTCHEPPVSFRHEPSPLPLYQRSLIIFCRHSAVRSIGSTRYATLVIKSSEGPSPAMVQVWMPLSRRRSPPFRTVPQIFFSAHPLSTASLQVHTKHPPNPHPYARGPILYS